MFKRRNIHFIPVHRLIIFLFCLYTSAELSAQSDSVYTIVEQMPEFPGGPSAMMKFVQTNLYYPPLARENNVEGKVFVRFVVDTNGRVIKPTVIKSAGDESLNKEAIRVVSSMPLWQPGIQAGKKVAVLCNLPIGFQIQKYTPEKKEEKKLSAEEKNLSEDQEKAGHFFKLGMDQERQERYEFALNKFDLALKYDPNHNRAKFHKGLMHFKLNDKTKACETWKGIQPEGGRDAELEKIITQHCK